MKTNKPEVVAYATHHDEPMLFPSRGEASLYCDAGEEPLALIRISDYESLQAARDLALEHIAEWLKWADTDPWANAHTVAACVAELEEVLRYPASCLKGPSHDL